LNYVLSNGKPTGGVFEHFSDGGEVDPAILSEVRLHLDRCAEVSGADFRARLVAELVAAGLMGEGSKGGAK
jgi:hypothetical protein